MDHSQPPYGEDEPHRCVGPEKSGGNVAEENATNEAGPLSPHLPDVETLVISPASSSIGSPSRDLNNFSHDLETPIQPSRLDFEKDCDINSPLYNNAIMTDDEHSVQSGNVSRMSISSSKSNLNDPEKNLNQISIGLDRTPSLNLSTYSGYDSEEDEDGVIRRFHDHAKTSLRLNLSIRSDDDSVYSEVNTSEDVNDDANGVSNGNGIKRKKSSTERIKNVIHGMRKAHEDAQRQRSTRQFLAMSEGNRSAFCLSEWCDFSYGRGMLLMIGVLFILVAVFITLSKFGHLTGGIWTFTLGILIIILRRFWVGIYWLVWGQFVQKRQRRNIQMYYTLNGERNVVELSAPNFEKVNTGDVVDYNENMTPTETSSGELA